MSPRRHASFVCCWIGVDRARDAVAARQRGPSAESRRCFAASPTARRCRPARAPRSRAPRATRAAARTSWRRRPASTRARTSASPSVAVVVPVTGVASKRAENLSQREHAPRVGDRRVPASALHAAERAAHEPRHVVLPRRHVVQRDAAACWRCESAEIMSHHSASVFSVEKPIVVPWKLRRERRICSAALKPLVVARQLRLALEDQVPVDHRRRRPQVRLDREAVEPLRVERLRAARQRFERRDLADREVGGRQRASSGRCGPRRSRSSACSMRCALALGNRVAGLVARSTARTTSARRRRRA